MLEQSACEKLLLSDLRDATLGKQTNLTTSLKVLLAWNRSDVIETNLAEAASEGETTEIQVKVGKRSESWTTIRIPLFEGNRLL